MGIMYGKKHGLVLPTVSDTDSESWKNVSPEDKGSYCNNNIF